MKFKLPKLFKWNIKVSYIIALENTIHIDFLVPTDVSHNSR